VSDESREPSRIILPGGGKPGGLVGPDGRPLFATPPEDVPEAERLPSHPRLRAVEMQEAQQDGRTLVVLVDPSGVAPQALAVAAEAMPVLMMLDGSVALEDLVDLLTRETGDTRAGDSIRTLVEELDRRLFLESPRYEAALAKAREEWRAQPAREAALAGLSYPEDPAELDAFLAAFEETARAWKRGDSSAPGLTKPAPAASAPDGALRALAAPHIDLRRGGPVTARAFLEFSEDSVPDVVFIFGTGHLMVEEPFAVTGKSFDTPLGLVTTDGEIVAALEAACGPTITREELAHRDEHSIEFQALELKRRFGARAFTIVPLLAGGFGGLVRFERRPADEPRVETLIAALRAEADRLTAAGRRVAFVAGVDLSHVGARFGDALDMDAETLASVEKVDRAALAAALAGDAEGWFDAIAAQGDATRICGFAPMYLMLRVARPGAGRLLAYEQSVEESGSVVTYASIAWP
jgi:hypothetical protein